MSDPRFAGRGVPDPGFPDDDGTADPALVHALQDMAAGGGDASSLLRALAGARLLVPVVAVLEEAEVGADGLRHEKTSSMASVTVLAPDGRRALVAFTSTQSLRTWRDDARPIAAEAWRVAQATLAEGADVLLVDASGPVPFAVEGAELRALALGADPTLPPHLDDGVASAVASVCAGEPSVLEARLEAGDPKGVRVVVVVDDTIPIEDFRALVPRLNGALAAAPVLRARAEALQVALVPPSMRPASGVVAFRRG